MTGFNVVGNVWEWVNETVTVVIPISADTWHYVNTTSMNWSTSSSADDGTYGGDGTYFGTAGSRAVLRGGSWANGALAGPFCAILYNVPSLVSRNFGFRCCANVES